MTRAPILIAALRRERARKIRAVVETAAAVVAGTVIAIVYLWAMAGDVR